MSIFASNIIHIMQIQAKKQRGGKREGAGRPKTDSRLYTFRAPGQIADIIDAQENKTEFIRKCIQKSIGDSEKSEFPGEIIPAVGISDVRMKFFDIGVAAGFPIPLDNDEKGQDIELLRMLCPNPESCYLIRIKGDSMNDAGIYSGDIVIVDKSNRHPLESQVAVCELNGEYTVKRLAWRNGTGWLIPANPDYPEIQIMPDDDFSVWGTVTFIIHRPRN